GKMLVHKDGSTVGSIGGGAIEEAVRESAVGALEERPRLEAQTVHVAAEGDAVSRRSQARPGDARVMVEVHEAPGQLVVVGGGHVGLALATMGHMLGFRIIVIDDREEFANEERFPMAEQVIAEEPAPALDALDINDSTYAVLVSRGHTLDEEGLRHLVGRGAAYVGMIGSRRRTGTVLQHLADDGFDLADLENVYTPIGLDIGAETPEEIAMSILSEMVLERRGGTGGQMREVKGRARLTAPTA
ncbi:MAG: XdhC/CoxI family protein, partial [Chloroflexi bacterium]|nr:XdhC/CoxI family protein [Chloroflexota bacterium]